MSLSSSWYMEYMCLQSVILSHLCDIYEVKRFITHKIQIHQKIFLLSDTSANSPLNMVFELVCLQKSIF